ncbi:MAG: type I DNA topoisomerase [Ancrocorticia sp.]|jgi:DNA topoisomerase I (EC 5.99.1.2)|nr:type I DNA topoisomerase [Ancrocorticia sp.]MCI1896043.1 type I DNA topoisomerase [Ancrocorticia sp.]MCI1932707.1 type I DNA topoisomerase [Ancrocorticia sp.]MCI2029415.1 type I DNA topoisomerase [Ancrocorticia sp.]MCI2178146.1 type I DNA topoisomerase [Ancrocorticia sp.]
MKKLVIVESPAKSRTISAFLGPDYDVEASIGHIRDLPQPSELPADMKKGPYGRFAVDVDHDFTPYYVIAPDKKKKVAELKRQLKDADELLLATDEDREGEAIAWHLYEVLKPKIPVKRMVFHEITPEAIDRALREPRELDLQLVDAQESRRILDRLVGYEVSPLLWRKVAPGLSAGRVQSVATRLVVDRERERMAFSAVSYWDVTGTFAKDAEQFDAKLAKVDGSRIASGKDFTDQGTLKAKSAAEGVTVLDGSAARAIAAQLVGAPAAVSSVETKPYTRRPAPPFTTSTLQQEASRKLRMSARDTMRTAQGLYENGYITYMRTDSTNLSDQALGAARGQIAEIYGESYLPSKPRRYVTKSKGAQEAHEAIRPAGDHFRTPAQVKHELSGAQFSLYELIWKRTVASQMADAKGQTASVRIVVSGEQDLEFAASGTVITFPGFMAAYQESADARRYAEKPADAESRLPALAQGEALAVRAAEPDGHETQPPPRYTEASLVKKMEELGIGRPSTYAATIATISDRGYVEHRGQALVPTWTAFSVVRLLEKYLPNLVDYDFTASMETELDRIAAGEERGTAYLDRFWRGSDGHEGLEGQVEGLGDIDARAINSVDLGDGIVLRVGRYGPYVQEAGPNGEDLRHASVPEGVAPDELTLEKARELLDSAAADGRELGVDPVTKHTIVAKAGRFGPYVTEVIPEGEVALTPSGKPSKRAPKPRTASLFHSMSLETVTLDQALQLLSLPRMVGNIDGEDVLAQNGRYGPYITKGKDSRSLASEEQIFTLTIEQAAELFAQPKQRRGATAKPPLKELGEDPVTGKPVLLKDGRFGPYVTDGVTNASLRRSDDPNTLTNERAYELLADRRAAAPKKAPKKRAAKKPASSRKSSATARKPPKK